MTVEPRPSDCSFPLRRVGSVPPCTVTGFPPRRAPRAFRAWEEKEGGGGSAQAVGPGDSAGGRPRRVLGSSLPAAEPPRPDALVWALLGPPLLRAGPEPVPEAGILKEGGGPILPPDLTAKLAENSLRVSPGVSFGLRLRFRARIEGGGGVKCLSVLYK